MTPIQHIKHFFYYIGFGHDLIYENCHFFTKRTDNRLAPQATNASNTVNKWKNYWYPKQCYLKDYNIIIY